MKLELYHENLAACVGTIESVDDYWVAVNNGVGLINRKCCLGFKPKIGDKVVLSKDTDFEITGFVLTKYFGEVK